MIKSGIVAQKIQWRRQQRDEVHRQQGSNILEARKKWKEFPFLGSMVELYK